MGQIESSKFDFLNKGHVSNYQVNNEIREDQIVLKCGVKKLSNTLFQFVLKLNNKKYYQFQYQQQNDDGVFFENLIMVQASYPVQIDNLKLNDVVIFYQESPDPKSFFQKINQGINFDFDSFQIETVLIGDISFNNDQKFSQLYKISDQDKQLIFAQSRNNYILAKIDTKQIMKSSSQYICSHRYKLKSPLNKQEILDNIKKFQNIDDLIEAIKQ